MTITTLRQLVTIPLACLILATTQSPTRAGAADVIPLPQKIEKREGYVTIDNSYPLGIVLAGERCRPCRAEADVLEKELGKLRVATVRGKSQRGPTLYYGCAIKGSRWAAQCKREGAAPDPNWGPEGYRLKVTPEKIIVAGNNPQGTYYGLQTFRQMLEPIEGGKGVRVECVDIRDWPAMKWRGTMFGLQSPDEHARLGFYKMNLLNWEVNQNPDFKTIPEFTGGTPLRHYRKVAESCRLHHVSLVLETQSFGHVSWMLAKFPQLRALPDDTHVLRPLHGPTYDLIGRIYAELCPLYDTPIYHAGCDEAWGIEEWAKKKGLDVADVIGKHIQKLADMLRTHGKRTMIWGDYLLKHRGAIRHMNPKDFIVCDWHYSPTERYPSVDFFVEKGFETLVSPAVMPARPIFPNYERQIPNIRGFIQYGAKHGASGLLNTNWPVSPMPTEVYWYGWACGAEYAWNPTGRSQEEFDRAFFKQAYGLPAEQGLDLFQKMAKLGTYQRLDREAARAPKSLLGDAVRSGWQIVAPKLRGAQDEYLREARAALDAALKSAGPVGADRLKSFRQIIDRLYPASSYLEKTLELGHAIAAATAMRFARRGVQCGTAAPGREPSNCPAQGGWATTNGALQLVNDSCKQLSSANESASTRGGGFDSVKRASREYLAVVQESPGLPNRDEAGRLGREIQAIAGARQPVAERSAKLLGLLGLQRPQPSKTARLKPGLFFQPLATEGEVPPPHARREGWCHFTRKGGAAQWTFDVQRSGHYKLYALLRHSAGLYRGHEFWKGGRNAAYKGRYGWKLDGEPVEERWIGEELNPDADEALRWAILADREFTAGEHTLTAKTEAMNHAIVAEFVFTQDPAFTLETKRSDIRMQ